MKKNNIFLLTIVFLSSIYNNEIYSKTHEDIRKWRQAAGRGNLSNGRYMNEMQNMNLDEFKFKVQEMRRKSKDSTDDRLVKNIARKKTILGFCKTGLSGLFGASGGFLAFKVIPASLQFEDEQTRFAATFWSTVGTIGCFGFSYFFGRKGCTQIKNNLFSESVRQRLASHAPNLALVQEQFNAIHSIKNRNDVEEVD